MATANRKPTIPDVFPRVQELYARHPAGCHLHVVLDDGNVSDAAVKFCISAAMAAGCVECKEVGILLEGMSKTQRRKLYAMPKGT